MSETIEPSLNYRLKYFHSKLPVAKVKLLDSQSSDLVFETTG